MAYIDNVNKVLNIQPEAAPTRVRLSQNENGRNLYFTLAGNENPIPSGVTVTISGTKPDGTVYSGTGSISNDVVLIPETVQLTAVAGVWDAKVKITSGGNTVATGRIRFLIDADTVAPGSVPSSSVLEGLVEQAQQYAETARQEAYGSPLTAALASDMTDKTRVYVYTGSEVSYTAGHWYYWNGSAWTDGGVYNSTAVQTDKTLSLMDVAADGKAVGDAIAEITIPTDKTLTISDAPADALVVGEKLALIKEMIAGIEVTSTATKAYAIGDLVIVGDVLYKMTKAITSGTQIGSTNARKTTIDQVINSRFTDLRSDVYEQINDLDDEITSLKGNLTEIVQDYFGNVVYEPTNRGQAFPADISSSPSTININAPITNAEWSAVLIECDPGDVFYVTAQGGTTTYAWAFINSSGEILKRAASGAVVTDVKITAPENTAYLVVNDRSGEMCVSIDLPVNVAAAARNIPYKKWNTVFYIADNGVASWSGYDVSPPSFTPGNDDYVLKYKGLNRVIPTSDILLAAQNAGLTVADGTITGKSFAIVYNTDTDALEITKTPSTNAGLALVSKYPLIFMAHFKSTRAGLVVDFMATKRIDSMDASIDTNTQDISDIKKSINAIVPDYYLSHVQNKVKDIQTAMNAVGRDGETFVFITDLHWETNDKNSPALVDYILDHTNINNLLCGGDLINQGTKQAMIDVMRECVTAFQHRNIFMPIAYGNHDNNGNGTVAAERFSVTEQYALMQKQSERLVSYFSETNNANQNWNCYYDVANTKTRFVIINTGNNGSYNRFYQLADCLNATPDGYNIVLIAHWLMQNGVISSASRDIEAMCDAVNAKETVTLPGKGTTHNMNGAKGTVHLILAGHAHYNDNWYSANGIPVVVIDCDSGSRSKESSYVSGTVTEQSFGVFTADYVTGDIVENKIGRGVNQIYHPGVNDVSVGNTLTLTDTINATSWESADTTIATVNAGVVTPVVTGNVVIKAISATHVENWCVSVTA